MSKPKIFQQMESAGSFWITDNNMDDITFKQVATKFRNNIPVYLIRDSQTIYTLSYISYLEEGYTSDEGLLLLIFSCTEENSISVYQLTGRNSKTINQSEANYSKSEVLVSKSGDTMTGSLLAKANIANSRQMRNITLSTAEPSSGENGDVWIQYEE